MKKLINFTLIAIASLAVACHKDATLTRLQPVGFTGSPTASTNTAYLSASTDSTNVITFNWPAVVFPVKARVTYTLYADLTTDTTGSTGWANATSIAVGADVLTKTFKGADLNTLALNLGIGASDTSKLVFRIEAYQDRTTYSKALTIIVSPWKPVVVYSHNWPVLYLPGDYQGWSPSTAPTAAAEISNIYEGYINEVTGGTYQFKFTSAADWNHINYGDSGTPGLLTINGLAAGMTLPGAGYYEVTANTTTLAWTYTLTTWGIIGDATPGGWTTDTQLTYDSKTNSWSVTAAMLASGSFKFRANNQWSIDFGVDASGHLAYADNPAYPYNGSRSNLTVPTNGTYKITLYLGDPNNYHYTAVKQ